MLQRIEGDSGVPVAGEGLYFRMRWGHRTVRFFATTGLLAAIAGDACLDERQAFLAWRDQIEALAAAHYFMNGEREDGIVELTGGGPATPRPPIATAVAA